MTTTDLDRALLKLSPRNGDIVFFDARFIDPSLIAQCVSPSPEQDDVIFIPVYGSTVHDAVMHMSKEQLTLKLNK